jgi:hypothetical protein
LKANYLEYRLQYVRLDNTVEFSSRAFNDYCMTQKIKVQHSVSYVHTQNGLTKSLIKRIKLIARPLLYNWICLLLVRDMQFYMLLTLFNCDRLHIIVFSHYILYAVMLQAFFIYENLVVQYMHQFDHLSVPRWALTEKWVFMCDIISHLL